MAEDLVNHPSHYAGQGAIECKELMKAVCLAYEGYVAVCVGNVLKYCWRCHGKETVRSLKSAKWYLDEAIKMIQDFPVSEQERLFNKSVFLYSMDEDGTSERARFLVDVYLQMGKYFGKEEFAFFKAVVDGLFDGGLYRDASLSVFPSPVRTESFHMVAKALDDWIDYFEGKF